jgi:hypothetical protein
MKEFRIANFELRIFNSRVEEIVLQISKSAIRNPKF